MESSFPPSTAIPAEGSAGQQLPDTSQRSEGSGGWGPTMGTGNAALLTEEVMPSPRNPPDDSSLAFVFTAEQQQQQGGGSITRFASHTPTPAGYVSPFAAPPASYAERSQLAYSSAQQSPYGGGTSSHS